jgi:hypothetical protein
MFGLYKDVAVLAAKRAVQSWLAALSIPIYAFIVVGAAVVAAPLGMIGGFLVGFVAAACFGAYLSLLGPSLDGTKIRLVDLKTGLRAIWDVVSVFFAFWVIGLGVGMLKTMAGPKADAVGGVAALAAAIFFNVVPELIYQGRSRSFALLKESAEFVMDKAFVWFPPNLVIAFVVLWATNTLTFSSPGELLVRLSQLGSMGGVLSFIGGAPRWMAPLLIAFVHFAMVFRGLLFRELSSGSTRMRAFRRSTER